MIKRELKKDHIYWELKWQEEFKERFKRKPDEWEYPEVYDGCNCRQCAPERYRYDGDFEEGDLPLAEARTAPLGPLFDHLGIGRPVERGSEKVAHCPFHDDSKPSMRVDTARNFWYCFPCGTGGDIIDLWIGVTGESFPEAIHHIVEVAYEQDND